MAREQETESGLIIVGNVDIPRNVASHGYEHAEMSAHQLALDTARSAYITSLENDDKPVVNGRIYRMTGNSDHTPFSQFDEQKQPNGATDALREYRVALADLLRSRIENTPESLPNEETSMGNDSLTELFVNEWETLGEEYREHTEHNSPETRRQKAVAYLGAGAVGVATAAFMRAGDPSFVESMFIGAASAAGIYGVTRIRPDEVAIRHAQEQGTVVDTSRGVGELAGTTAHLMDMLHLTQDATLDEAKKATKEWLEDHKVARMPLRPKFYGQRRKKGQDLHSNSSQIVPHMQSEKQVHDSVVTLQKELDRANADMVDIRVEFMIRTMLEQLAAMQDEGLKTDLRGRQLRKVGAAVAAGLLTVVAAGWVGYGSVDNERKEELYPTETETETPTPEPVPTMTIDGTS